MNPRIRTRWGLILAGVSALAVSACKTSPGNGVSTGQSGASKSGGRPVLKNLLSTELEGVDGTEVIVSHVTIPPHTSLPKHWHPGEEFAYVLEGSVTLWQKGKADVVGRAGEVMKVPLKQVHTAMTGDDGVKLLVFRVHEQGQPERVPAD